MGERLINNKNLMSEWCFERNSSFDPTNLIVGSGKKVSWHCSKCGYIWESRIADRYNGKGCPVCANRITITGINDLASRYPLVCKEWDYENNKIDPTVINCHSLKEAHWVCSKGHKWKTKINYRTYGGQGCPVCANLKVEIGFNDLQSQNPKLMREWDYENNKIRPDSIVCNSRYKAHWVCQKGHKWVASVESRNRGNGCPYCVKEKQVSFPEKAILYYLRKIYGDVIENYRPKWLKGQELDIYIPNIKVGIEYDGERWHKDVKRDLRKDNTCFQNDIRLYRIREAKCINYESSSTKILLNSNNYNELNNAISELISYFGVSNINFTVDCVKDQTDIENLIERSEKEQSFAIKRPKIAKLWDYKNNNLLKPDNYTVNSHLVVYWKCKHCNNSYRRSIRDQVSANGKCPICNNTKVVSGVNDFATRYPNLLKEWNYQLNNADPTKIILNGDNPVWWNCPNGHTYKANIYSRTKNKTGCPYCTGRLTITGKNDLLSLNYEYMQDWDYAKNENIDPSKLKSGSSKMIWWKCCKCGYEWQATVKSRTKGSGCLKCYRLSLPAKLSKKVYQYDINDKFIREFSSVSEAGRTTGIKHISSVCRGERVTAGGFKWKYHN